MKREAIGVVLLSVLSLFAGEFSKEDILRHAFKNSEILKQINQDRKISQSVKKEYFGKGLPTVEGVAKYEHKLKSYNPYDFSLSGGGSVLNAIDGNADGAKNDSIIAGAFDMMTASFGKLDLSPKKNSAAFGIQITQPIFAQGKVITGVRIADVYADAIEQRYQAGQYELAKKITDSYNAALLAQANLHIQEEAVSLAQESHRLTKTRFETGKGKVLDTLNTRFSVQRALFSLRSAQKDKRLAIENMLTTASLEMDVENLVLTDSLVREEFALSFHDARERMIENNRNLTQLQLAEEIQALQTTLAKSDFLPIVVAGASFMGVSQFDEAGDIDFSGDHKIFAGLTIPIFSGGQRVEKVHQAKLEESKLSEKKQELTNKLQLALAAAFEELEVAGEEIAEAEEMVALTQQGLKISITAYEVGQITQLDLTTSEQQYRMAKLAMNSAVYKVNRAVTAIRELIAEPALIAVAKEIK